MVKISQSVQKLFKKKTLKTGVNLTNGVVQGHQGLLMGPIGSNLAMFNLRPWENFDILYLGRFFSNLTKLLLFDPLNSQMRVYLQFPGIPRRFGESFDAWG